MDVLVKEKPEQNLFSGGDARRERLEILHKRFPELSIECIIKMGEDLPHQSEVYRKGKGAP